MKPLRVVIAEDEGIARAKLARLLAAEPDLTCVGEAADGPAAVRLLGETRPDLLFLDVRMPGLSGLEVLARAPRPRWVIFTTAYDQYAVAAFDADAVDYLVKPFGPTRFREALTRVRRRRAEQPTAGTGHITRLIAVEANVTRVVPIGDVIRFEARDDYVAAWTAAGRHLLAMRMATLEAGLDPSFVRVHRSHIVSLARIVASETLDGGRRRLTLSDGSSIEASRAGARRLRAQLPA